MGDPLLISSDETTGEGVLQLDDGSRVSVHLPSAPGLIYTDAREQGVPPSTSQPRMVRQTDPTVIRRPSWDDGVLGGGSGAPSPVFAPPPPGQQVAPVRPAAAPALFAEPVDRSGQPIQRGAPMGDGQPLTPAQLEGQREALLGAQEPGPEVGFPSERGLVGGPVRAPAPPAVGTRASLERPLFAEAAPVPEGVPPEWLAPQAGAPSTPEAIPSGMRGPTQEEIARGRAADAVVDGTGRARGAPSGARGGGGGGGFGSAQSPGAPGILPRVVRDFGVPDRFDQTIGEIAGPRRDLVDRQTDIAQRQAQLAEDDARRQQRALAASEDERASIEQERRGAVMRAQDSYQRAIDRVASARIDPNRWFRDQGAFGAIGATIAVALGALGSAVSGSSTNAGLDTINQAIERDLDAQRSEIDSGRAAADLQSNMLNVVGREFTDREAARQAARAAMLDQAALELQAQTADVANDEALVNAEAMRGQLAAAAQAARMQAIELQSQIDLRAAQARRSTAQAMRDERRAAGGGVAAAPRITPTMLDAYHRLVQDGVPQAEASQRAGLGGLTPELHTDVTQAEGNVAALEGSLSFLESIIPGEGDIPGVGRLDSLMPAVAVSEEGLVLRRAAEDVVELYARLHSGGAITDTEAARFVRLVGAGAGMSDDDLRRGVAAVRREIDARSHGTPQRGAAPDRDLSAFGGAWVDEGAAS